MDEFDVLAALIADKWYGGTLPPHPTIIAKVVMGITPEIDLPVPAAVLAEAKRRFADSLAAALSDRIAAQHAAQSPWQS